MERVKLASGIELAVEDTGPRDGPALLFLHGFPENHRTWRHQVAHFSDRFRCIAPDQRGIGTNGLYLPTALDFRCRFGAGSRARHEAEAQRLGIEPAIVRRPGLALDLDTPADLRSLGGAPTRTSRFVDRAERRA